MALSQVFKEIPSLNKSLRLSRIKGVVTTGQDPTRPSFQPVERNERNTEVVKKTVKARQLMEI